MRHRTSKMALIVEKKLRGGLWALSISQESKPVKTSTQAVQNETISESIEIKALLDYESGLVFYKDDSIAACLVEAIPEHILESPGASTFKIPIPSDEVCIGRDNELLKTQAALISEPGLLFCNGLPILDISKLAEIGGKPVHKSSHQNGLVRRKRQSNGYYRSSVPLGEARAASTYVGQPSQAQVQGQVFGNAFFSGQAQTQSGGMSQSQVQLSGVGIRGQIASSSGNAQAQLSLGNGAGSGQASGLGDGPSNSQVQVTLGQQGEESMASASATSGGATAGIGEASPPGGFPIGSSGHFRRSDSDTSLRNGGAVYGFTPGVRLFDDSGTLHPYGGGIGVGDRQDGGQIGNVIGQRGQTRIEPHIRRNGIHQGVMRSPITGTGIADSRLPYNIGGLRNGDMSYGSGSGPTGTIGEGIRSDTRRPQGTYEQAAGISNGLRLSSPGSTNQGIASHGTTGIYGNDFERGSRFPTITSIGETAQRPSGQIGSGSFGLQQGEGASGLTSQRPGETYGRNGNQRTSTQIVDAVFPQGGSRYGSHIAAPGGRTYYNGGGSTSTGPYSQSSTPGAYAVTHGLGQAQAQTVYFGSIGNGQYRPIRYDQSSQPGETPGLQRFQDQQVGFGSAGQRQHISQSGTGNGADTGAGTGWGGLSGHRHNGLRNGQASYGYENGKLASTAGGQQPGSETGTLPTSGIHQPQPGIIKESTDLPGTRLHPSNVGSTADGSGYSSSQTSQPGTSSGGQPLTGYNGSPDRDQRQSQSQTTPFAYRPDSTSYQTGQQSYGQPTTSTIISHGRNGQTYSTNGYNNGRYGQQLVPSVSTNGHRITGDPTQLSGPPSTPNGRPLSTTGNISQDGFSPSYGISRPSEDDPDGRKCTIITFSCTIIVESNGRAKICKPSAVRMNGNGNAGANGGTTTTGSKICCC